jgi:uncharacterized protein
MDTAPRLIPCDTDRDTGGFFDAARRHELVVRVCDSCSSVLHLPVAYCHHCSSWEGSWKQVSGQGRLYSSTIVDHQVHPSFPTPYTIVLVELQDAPEVRMVGHMDGAHDLAVDQRMEVWWEDLPEGVVIPQWRPAA